MVTSANWFQQAVKYSFPWAATASEADARTRQDLYADLDGYYYNSIWSEQSGKLIRFMAGWASDQTVQGLYNPVKTIVDFYRTHTLRGELRPDGEPGEVATIESENSALVEPILRIWRWSELERNKRLLGRFAANLGDCLLVAVDMPGEAGPETARVQIEVRHPGELVDWEFDALGEFRLARLAETRYERDGQGNRKPYKYERLFTLTSYATFKDGQPHEYRVDAAGRPLPPMAGDNPATGRPWAVGEWPNPHGFCPVVLVKHEDDGDEFGLNAWHALIPAINEVNLRGTHLGDMISQHFAALWAAIGVSPPTTVSDQGVEVETELDRGKMIYLPPGADLKAVVAQIDFENAYVHIDRILQWMKDTYPELTLPELRKKTGDLSGVAVRGMLLDLIAKAEEVERAYTAGLVKVMQMALRMGANVGGMGQRLWPAFAGEDAMAPDLSRLDFTFRWLAIIPLSENERLALQAEKEALGDEIEGRRAARAAGGEADAALNRERARGRGREGEVA